MSRFVRSENEVVDNETNLVWNRTPIPVSLWNDLTPPAGKSIPSLEQLQTLIDGQKAVPEDFAAAFGTNNAPVVWYWVSESKTPGHVAAWFNWAGNKVRNRRLLKAFCRFVE